MKDEKSIRIAIHHEAGSYSQRWIEYCEENDLFYQLINCFEPDIIGKLQEFNFLLWHWHHSDYASQLAARHIIQSAELAGLKVFPNIKTCWHFDDKIAQKYLLEAKNIPFVKSWVFYNMEDTLQFLKRAKYPLVFKLRRGASSENVSLIPNYSLGTKKVKKMFSKGYKITPTYFANPIQKFQKIKNFSSFKAKLLRLHKVLANRKHKFKYFSNERGYFFCQEYLPENSFDTRITIIGSCAFAFRRFNRKNDFRVSGSGNIDYNKDKIDVEFIKVAFHISKNLELQTAAFDFLYDNDRKPVIIELSYGYLSNVVYNCPGFWDENLNWHSENKRPEDLIIENLLKSQN